MEDSVPQTVQEEGLSGEDLSKAEDNPGSPSAFTYRFSREKLLAMKRYRNQVDILAALLKPGATYTIAEADGLMNNFLRGKVK